ncbi:hypothetical protein JHK85_050543 [Glycine max]|nr:hypothetical protein JHK85_050543 [Glycine max]
MGESLDRLRYLQALMRMVRPPKTPYPLPPPSGSAQIAHAFKMMEKNVERLECSNQVVKTHGDGSSRS